MTDYHVFDIFDLFPVPRLLSFDHPLDKFWISDSWFLTQINPKLCSHSAVCDLTALAALLPEKGWTLDFSEKVHGYIFEYYYSATNLFFLSSENLVTPSQPDAHF